MDAIYLVKMYVEPKLFGNIVLALIDHNKPFTSMPMLRRDCYNKARLNVNVWQTWCGQSDDENEQ